MYCIKCGAVYETGEKYCSKCGAEIRQAADVKQAESRRNVEYAAANIMEPRRTANRKTIVITAAIAAAVCIVIAAVIFARGGSTEKRLAEQLNLAERYLSELDYEQAIAAYEAAIEIDPRCEEAYLGLADIYIEQGDYEKAIEILEAGLARIDSEAIRSKLEEAEEAAAGRVPYTVEMAAIAAASVGDIVYWGCYEQDNDPENGTEPVEWYVLDKADGEATLLSVYLLDYHLYYADIQEVLDADSFTWEDCNLRSWLNGEFYNAAFSEKEQAAIVDTNVVNEDNFYRGTEGGNDTIDKIWLLSLGEMERYFHIDRNVWGVYADENMSWYEYAIYCYGQDHRVCAKPTAYAEARGVGVYSEGDAQRALERGYDTSYAIGSGYWWLRSPGRYVYNAAFVTSDGGNSFYGDVVYIQYGVRPALKVAY